SPRAGPGGSRVGWARRSGGPAGNGNDPAAAARGALGGGAAGAAGAGGAGGSGGAGGAAAGMGGWGRGGGVGGVGGGPGVTRAGREVPGKASAAGGGGGSCDTSGTPSIGTDLVSRHGSPRRIPSVPVGRDALGMIGPR